MVLSAMVIAPIMQKVNDITQSLRIGLNIMICMFIWQVPMGLEIVLKVLKFLMYQIHSMILVFLIAKNGVSTNHWMIEDA